MMKIAIIGPSGCGKTTIINKYIEQYGNFSVSKNYTTRNKRHEDDNEFIFMSEDEFKELINNEFFFEHEYIFNNYYGTPKSNLSKNNVFFNVDIKGAIKLKESINNLIIIFIITPCRQTLINRLTNRQCNSDIERRLKRIDEEVQKHHISNYKIINDDLSESVKTLRSIIEIEQMRSKFDEIIREF
jgi:guanylate kinase